MVRRIYRPGLIAAIAILHAACGRGDSGTHDAPALKPGGEVLRPASDGTAPRTLAQVPGAGDGALVLSANILIDQFGYRPQDPKVAVIRSPMVGFDAKDPFSPGARYEVQRAEDGHPVFSGVLVPWEGGKVEASSGDRGWWFDFSRVTATGRYRIVDVQRGLRSPTFSIDPLVYRKVLKAAMRTYFYQRSGMAKKAPFADPCWVDSAAYAGPGQDGEARDVTDRGNPAKVRDLSGGWFDAGDTNKYLTFAMQPVHQLLNAYEHNPRAFTDDFNIPESGNGVPDLVDEVKWETDWLKRMQYPDGSAALKVGEIVNVVVSPPGSDRTPRYYVPGCTAATIAAAGMFAHASYVDRKFPALAAEAIDLRDRALLAWRNFQAAPFHQTQCDSRTVLNAKADLDLVEQNAAAVEAAIYLFAVTGDAAFQDYVREHYRETRPYRDFGWSRYSPDQGEALLFYTALANADPALRTAILEDKRKDVAAGNHVYGFDPHDDLYRAYLHDEQYHWGSNNPRANYGNTNLDAAWYRTPKNGTEAYRQRALEILHYFHGVNPMGIVYLSNMNAQGATRSVDHIWHTWFQTGTKWSAAGSSECGPAPGYVPGGPNANAAHDGVPPTLQPPTGQPAQKSYRDWNENWPDSSWVISEPAIYFQSAYVELLSAFAQ